MDLAGTFGCVFTAVFLAAVFGVAIFLGARSRKQEETWDELADSPGPPPSFPTKQQAAPARPRTRPASVTRSPQTANARWTGAGESISVAGRTFDAPWVWFGTELKAAGDRYGTEAALVNPRLPVDFAAPDSRGEGMGYWPRYADISPQCRAAYLQWLADGRQGPHANIGYVFLYFYGIERRLLVDLLPKGHEQPEVVRLLAEVRRLRELYKENASFASYSGGLLDFVQAGDHARQDPTQLRPPLHSSHWDLPLGLRVALGKQLSSGQPLTADWALAWGLHHFSVGKRTPVDRCRDEVIALFRIRFEERYPGGMKVKAPKRRIKVEYRSASPSLLQSASSLEIDLPDVGALSAPLEKVHAVLDACCDELASYSRWVGRNPDQVGSLQAAALLPPILIATLDTPSLSGLRSWLAGLDLNGGDVGAQELLGVWQPASGKWSKKDSVQLCQLLDGHGVGVEPDARFGGARLDNANRLVLFRLESGAPDTPSNAYQSATLALHLATAVVHADGVIDTQEEEGLERLLERNLHLSSPERTRLRAHLRWLLLDHPGMGGLSTRLKALAPSDRTALAKTMAAMATAGGGAGPSELKLLEKIYKHLGQDPTQLYEHVHQAAAAPASDQGPITVREGRQGPVGHSIPGPPQTSSPPRAKPGFELDLERVAHRVKETEQVARILGDIFDSDDLHGEPERTSPDEPAVEGVAGLDEAHSALVRILVTQPTWQREDAEARADALGLFLGGAIETINDATYDHCDAPLVEGDEELEIDPQVAAELCP
ncbi:MAG: TerB N-terminal domain-containing protein [Alphaproteobacteria bacterium]|nr:TerB N-terminal domain-containing protein [Alphaproteobacteria bacterium]